MRLKGEVRLEALRVANAPRESGFAGKAGLSEVDVGIAAVAVVVAAPGTAAIAYLLVLRGIDIVYIMVSCSPDDVVPARSQGFGGLAMSAALESIRSSHQSLAAILLFLVMVVSRDHTWLLKRCDVARTVLNGSEAMW